MIKSCCILGLSGIFCWGMGTATIAQSIPNPILPITADTTLPLENSVVTSVASTNTTIHTITGGTQRGGNLFHSFEAFSIPAGETAVFVTDNGIENILSRVTGNSSTRLDGVLEAGDRANLFLINPNGILIGPTARLNIGGSFFASTAQGLRFDNQFVYGTDSPTVPPLLTVSAPIGLVLGESPGAIQVTGARGAADASTAPSFSVPERQRLSLIGGDVLLSGGRLTAAAGSIELASLVEGGELPLTVAQGAIAAQTPSLNLNSIQTENVSLGEVRLSDQAVVDVSGPGGGAIRLLGKNVALLGGSALISDTVGDQDGRGIEIFAGQLRSQGRSFIGAATTGTGASSNVKVNATEAIVLEGFSFQDFKDSQDLIFLGGRQISDRQTGGIFTFTNGSGKAGNITLQAPSVQLNQGTSLSTETLGTGRSGDIEIAATDRIGLDASGIYAQSLTPVPLQTERIRQTPTGLDSRGIPAGDGGNITINTAQLLLEDGSAISASTLSDGDAGNLVVNATASITLQETPVEVLPLPSLFANVTVGGNGAAGNTTINTGRLLFKDATRIYSVTGIWTVPFGGPAGDITITATESVEIIGSLSRFIQSGIDLTSRSQAPAGNLKLTTPKLSIREGGNITSTTFGSGQGGAIQIDAAEIVVSDPSNINQTVSGIFSSSGAQPALESGSLPVFSGPATGNSGTITLDTQTLLVQDQATISVASSEFGSAGNLDITAETIRLDGRGSLNASTVSGSGGNIAISANKLALDNSRITAGATQDNGGNLFFNLGESLLLRNGSLISTEAGATGAGGNGGDIDLNADFIVAVPTENSDIRANAFAGDGGNVNIAARSLLGIAFRPNVLDTPLSDITASSQFGRSGAVTITEVDSEQLQEQPSLPQATATPTIARGCGASGTQTSRFVITGRGGLPINPVAPASPDGLWQDLAMVELDNTEPFKVGQVGETKRIASRAIAPKPQRIQNQPLKHQRLKHQSSEMEAQQWRKHADGTVTLFSQTRKPIRHLSKTGTC